MVSILLPSILLFSVKPEANIITANSPEFRDFQEGCMVDSIDSDIKNITIDEVIDIAGRDFSEKNKYIHDPINSIGK